MAESPKVDRKKLPTFVHFYQNVQYGAKTKMSTKKSGRNWDGKTKLSRAFYFAHLYYARDEPGILTDWHIVRTPQDPGIHNQVVLLKGLVKNGFLTIEAIHEGPY